MLLKLKIKRLPVLTGLILLAIALASASCAGAPVTLAQPTQTQAQPQSAAQPSDTPVPAEPTPEPTATAQPKKVVLVSPPGSDRQESEAVEQALAGLSAQEQMAFESREALQAGDLTPDIAVTVWLDAPANLDEMASAAPNTVFIVYSSSELKAGSNVSVVRLRPEYQAFVGGFITVLLSPQWRAAGLLPGDGPLGETLVSAFVNGGRYFCGVCSPGWPLGVRYPQPGVLDRSSAGTDWQAAAANLFDVQKVDAYYLAAEAAKTEVYTYLLEKDQFGTPVRVAGAVSPPEMLQDQWAATVRFDLLEGLRQAWGDAAVGKGGVTVNAPLRVENINPDHLGDGKMRLVNELLEEIEAGRIYPFTVPAE